MTCLRIAFWAVGMVAFGAMAAQWFRVEHRAAKLLAVLTLAWSLFCAYWLTALLWQTFTGERLPQFEILSTVAVGLLAMSAVFFLLRFPNGDT